MNSGQDRTSNTAMRWRGEQEQDEASDQLGGNWGIGIETCLIGGVLMAAYLAGIVALISIF